MLRERQDLPTKAWILSFLCSRQTVNHKRIDKGSILIGNMGEFLRKFRAFLRLFGCLVSSLFIEKKGIWDQGGMFL